MIITLCIPCVDQHIPLLLKLLSTVDDFTRKPDKIIISLSPKFENYNLINKKDEILKQFSHLPLEILVQNKLTHAAMHLNIMGKMIKDGYILRADADDIIHPQKLEIIEKIVSIYPDTKLLLHKVRCSKERNYNIKKFNYIDCANIENDILNVESRIINNRLLLCSDMFNKKYIL